MELNFVLQGLVLLITFLIVVQAVPILVLHLLGRRKNAICD